mmetsp:Transcript_9146/g.18510  ORF Transcript_9146/g.18510 Transcript_9146/m.18510 type:complete len:231 (-) Transcript_9146:65-757(-)
MKNVIITFALLLPQLSSLIPSLHTALFPSQSLTSSHLGNFFHTSLHSTPPSSTNTEGEPNSGDNMIDLVGLSKEGQPYVKCGKCQATYTIEPESLGRGKGKRLRCSVCSHSWFQSTDKLFRLKPGFEFTDFSQQERERVKNNINNGRDASFTGVAKFYVGNLDFSATESDLTEFFKKAGEVGDVSIVRDDGGRSRGFAFVTMVTEEGGDNAKGFDGEELMGRPVQVRQPN